jgi:hypothetical protein
LTSLNYLTSLSLPFSKLAFISLDLDKLVSLNLSHNLFTHLTSCLTNLVSLQRLDMSHNILESATSVLRVLTKLKRLVNLDLRSNPITEQFYKEVVTDEEFVKRTCWRVGCVRACETLEVLDGSGVERRKMGKSFEKLRRGVGGSLRGSRGVMSARELDGSEESLFSDWKPVSYPIEGGREGGDLVLRVSGRRE